MLTMVCGIKKKEASLPEFIPIVGVVLRPISFQSVGIGPVDTGIAIGIVVAVAKVTYLKQDTVLLVLVP
jgi:hypothetical protein